MADTFTTNLNLTKPEPGAAEDTWGISLNADLDALDAIFSSSGTQINLNPNQINFGDNKKAIFGAGGDLEIFHTGSSSIIKDSGTGNLNILADQLKIMNAAGTENKAFFVSDGGAYLYHNNSAKLETTSTGIDVTGTVTSDGLTVEGDATIKGGSDVSNTGATLQLESTETQAVGSGASISFKGDDGSGTQRVFSVIKGSKTSATSGNFNGGLDFFTRVTAEANARKRLAIASNGDISFYNAAGTSQALFWDASAESLGIGTTSPYSNLDVSGALGAKIYYTGGANSNNSGILVLGDGSRNQNYVGFYRGDSLTAGTLASLNVAAYQHIAFNCSADELGSQTERMRLTNVGRLGLGTTSPSALLHLQSTGDTIARVTSADGNTALLDLGDVSDPDGGRIFYDSGSNLGFTTASTERMRIDSSGRVGIGTTSPSEDFHISGDTSVALIEGTNTSTSGLVAGVKVKAQFYRRAGFSILDESNNEDFFIGRPYGAALPVLVINTDGSERARIDSSGNFLVAQTTQSPNTVGISLNNNGNISAKRNDGIVGLFNRGTSDGEIISIRKDDATIGSIGSFSAAGNSYLTIGSGDAGLLVNSISDALQPWNISTNAGRDAAIDLGATSGRFKDLYLSGGHMNGQANALSFISGGNASNAGANILLYGQSHASVANTTVFRASGSESARILSDGKLLVGKTAASIATTGVELRPNGQLFATQSANYPLLLNRTTSDGDIIQLRKDNTTVGSIGALGGDLTIGTGDTGLRFNDGIDTIIPTNISTNAISNNVVILGHPDYRFKDLYLGGSAYVGTSVGIGTTSPSSLLHISSTSPALTIEDSDATSTFNKTELQNASGTFNFNTRQSDGTFVSTDYQILKNASGANIHKWFIGGSEKLRLDASGRLGIGTTSPDAPLTVHSSSDPEIRLGYSSTQDHRITWDSAKLFIDADPDNGVGNSALGFRVDGSEVGRFDASGNFYVGTTDSTLYSATSGGGIFAIPNGSTTIARQSNTHTQPIFILNETGADGTLQQFRKDGSVVGAIGNNGDNLGIESVDVGLLFLSGSSQIIPTGGNFGVSDGTKDLGRTTTRFKDLYLSGGAYLGGTTSANKLDDYEEGVSSVTITPQSGTVSMPTTNNQFAYTKIGNVVHVSGYLYVNAVSSPTGFFDLSLPFTAADLTDKGADAPASLWMTNINSGANVADFMGVVLEGTNYIRVQLGDGVTVINDSAEQLKAGTQIKVSLTYKVA